MFKPKLTLPEKEELLRKVYDIRPQWSNLPDKFRTVCGNYAASINVPIDMFAYPTLSCVGSMLGHSMVTTEPDDDPILNGLPAILWTKVLAPSGCNKSSAFLHLHHALDFVQDTIRRGQHEMPRFYEG